MKHTMAQLIHVSVTAISMDRQRRREKEVPIRPLTHEDHAWCAIAALEYLESEGHIHIIKKRRRDG